MRIIELNARWIGAGGEGVTNADGTPAPSRQGVAVIMDCPCGKCGTELVVPFAVAVDGKPWQDKGWNRSGETIETLSLKPSVKRMDKGGCGWHGFITNGEALTC